MWDLYFTSYCNHKIINERLNLKGDYGSYYADLKNPIFGNSLDVLIVKEENMFDIGNVTLPFIIADNMENKRILLFNNVYDIRPEIYPKNNYYITYTTNKLNCPKCIFTNGLINDIHIDIFGKWKLNSGIHLLAQKFRKCLVTAINSNMFNYEYGTNLHDLVGKINSATAILMVQQAVNNTSELIKSQQSSYLDIIPDDEKLLKIDNFTIKPYEKNPKSIIFEWTIINYKNENLTNRLVA